MRRFLIFTLLLIWLVVVIAFYFIAHKPADNAQLSAMAAWIPGLIFSGVLVASAAALGYRFLYEWGAADQRLMLAVVLGLGIFSAAILLLGLIGIVRSEVAWLLVLGGLIVGWRSLKPLATDLRTTIGELHPHGWFASVCAIYCGVVLSVALLHALAPATAWDGLAYHLTGPQLYQQLGRITHPIDLPYLGFPQFGEMLFLQLQLLGGQTPSMLHWLFALLTTILVAGEARRLWREPIGWVAAAIFLSAETVILEAGWPYIDLMLAFCVLAAYVCLQAWRDDRTWRSLILAAVFTGFAMASKYSAAPVAVAFALLVLWCSPTARVRSLLVFSFVVGLVALPWYLKSWVLLGNPIYPFVFGGLHWDSLRSELFNRFGSGLLSTAPLQLLTAPWDATIWGVEGKLGYAATIGPLFLLLTPLTLLGWRTFDRLQRTRLIDQLIVIGLVYASWLYGLASSNALLQSRLLIPIFPLVAVIGAGAFQVIGRWDLPNLSLRRLASVLTALVLIMTGLKVTLDLGQSGVLPVLTGGITREDYLAGSLGWYYEAVRSINQLEPDATTLFLWEPRTLYCRTTCLPDAMLDNFVYARRNLGSARAIADAWRAQGIGYVLIWNAGYQAARQLALNRITPEDEQVFQQITQDELVLVKDYGGAYQLYRLKRS
ncbi:MAG TPA: glycosyltransferase family 39 protein [Anaerolineae bacterium]|nr:glycosyltransferase family 39 protein [Anaerolineae bacterium]